MSEFRRQHPIAAVTQLATVLRQNLFTLVILLFVGARNTSGYFWEIFLVGLVTTFVLGIASWFRFTFRVHEGELQINKGIFVRKKLYLSKDRIQVIDITEGIIQRVFGLVQVEVKSAGGGTEKATVSAITREEAEEMKQMLRSENVGSDPIELTEIEEVVEDQIVWKLSPRDLFYAALTSGNFGLIASILTATSGQLDQFITEENLDYIIDVLPGYSEVSIIVWAVIIIFFLSYLFSFVGVILSYSDFKITKKEKEILITSGLLERKQITVPFNRIQAIRFVEGILRQPFGYGMLYVESAGFEQKNNERSIVLHPFLKKAHLQKLFSEFGLKFENPEQKITPPTRSFFRYLRRPNYLLLLVPILWIFWDWAPWLFLLTIPFTLFGWLEYKDSELSYSSKFMKLQYRVLAKGTVFLNRKRAQVIETSINPFQQRKNLESVHVTVASGSGGRTFSITDLDELEVNDIRKWLFPEKSSWVFSPLLDQELGAVKTLLQEYGLPVSDLEESEIEFYTMKDGGKFQGCAGFEKFGEDALLRSVAVQPSARSTGLGKLMVMEMEKEVRNQGIQSLYLLTETAEQFFIQMGYERIERTEVPDALKQSKEFSELCADTAVAMRKNI